jgi:MFS transporter, putative metabolite:H+ symporter
MLQAAKPMLSDPSAFAETVAEREASPRWPVVLFSASGWFFDGYVINVWPLAIPLIMSSFGLSIKDVGLITSAYLVAYMLGTVGGGTLADYVGRKTMLSVSVLFYMIIDALTAFAQGFTSLAVFRFLTGTGTGMELPIGATFISEAVKEDERSRMISIMNLGYPLGYLLAIVMFTLIEPYWGWRGMFAASIIPGLLVYFVRRKVVESQRFETVLGKLKDGEIRRDRITLRTLLSGNYRKDAIIAAVYWVGNAFTFWSFLAFVPLYLVKVRHLTPTAELTYLGFWQIFYAAVPLFAGWLSDKWGRRPTAITFAILAGIGVWATTLIPSGPLLFLLGGLTYGAVAAPWIISFTHSAESFPTQIRGTAIGSTMAVGRLVAIVAPIVFGGFAEQHGIDFALRAGTFAWIFTIFGFLLSKETKGMRLEDISV